MDLGLPRMRRTFGLRGSSSGGYRARWAAEFEAGVRTAVDTARLPGAGPFQTLLEIIAL